MTATLEPDQHVWIYPRSDLLPPWTVARFRDVVGGYTYIVALSRGTEMRLRPQDVYITQQEAVLLSVLSDMPRLL